MKVPSPLSPTSNDPVRLAGHPLFTPENLYRAYRQCRRRKRKTANAMAFERDLEANLLALREELNSGDYMPGRSLAFLVERPKRREIFAADFRDRVVHHLLVGHLEPAWERRFIHDSYACRKGKGTHKGVERLRSFLRRATCSNTRPAWYLQLDVRGFFVAIDRQVLYQRLQAKEHDPAVLWLIRRVLFTEPARHCRLRGCHRSAFESLPPHKTLFKARPGCGLPIGNLTSQFFANVYLDALDQFVKHTLKAQWYLRYCDDLVLVSRDRHQLEAWEQRIETFLGKELKLDLNERRRLRPVSDGIDFLGYITRPEAGGGGAEGAAVPGAAAAAAGRLVPGRRPADLSLAKIFTRRALSIAHRLSGPLCQGGQLAPYRPHPPALPLAGSVFSLAPGAGTAALPDAALCSQLPAPNGRPAQATGRSPVAGANRVVLAGGPGRTVGA